MNFSSLAIACRVGGWLLWTDIQLFMRNWHNNVLDNLFWPIVLILANGRILPAMGMPADYGSFITVSMLVMMASFTAWSAANVLAADFATTRSIGYELTLPLPYWMVYTKIILHFACKTALFSLTTLVIGKILLWNTFDTSHFNIWQFALLYAIACIFFGTFAVWAASFAGNVERFMQLELRIAGPLFFICGYSFSYKTLVSISPGMAKLMLCSPWIYAYEGMHATILGQAEYLNIWLCCGMLVLFTALFFTYGLWLFKKRLDCV